MDPIKLNKVLASIVKIRDIQRNRVQESSLEQAGFRYYAEKLGGAIIEEEDKNTNITDKLHQGGTYFRKTISTTRLISKQHSKFSSKHSNSLNSSYFTSK